MSHSSNAGGCPSTSYCRAGRTAGATGVIGAMPPDYQVILVDNGSTDGSDEVAALSEPPLSGARSGYGSRGADRSGGRHRRHHRRPGLRRIDRPVGTAGPGGGVTERSSRPLHGASSAGRAGLLAAVRPIWQPTSWPRLSTDDQGLWVRDLAPVRVARRSDLLGLGVTDSRSGLPSKLCSARRAPAGGSLSATSATDGGLRIPRRRSPGRCAAPRRLCATSPGLRAADRAWA